MLFTAILAYQQDSVLMCGSAFFSAIFCVILVKGGDSYTELRYMIGTIGLFLSVQSHEAVTMVRMHVSAAAAVLFIVFSIARKSMMEWGGP